MLNLAVNCAVNTVSNVAANAKGLNVEFFNRLDISIFMLDILTVMDKHTTWPDYF